MDELIVVSRFVHFSAAALLFGGSLYWALLVPRHACVCRRWPAAIDIVAAAAALVSALGWYVGVAAAMAGSWSDVLEPDVIAAVAIETRFGRVWIARLALATGLLTLLVTARPVTRHREIVVLVLSAALVASLAGVGHGAVGPGRVGLLHLASDVLHLLCAAAWLGALAGLAVVLRRAVTKHDAGSIGNVRESVWRFSRFGYAAVGLLLVTGSVNAAVLVKTPQALVATDYGVTLLVKIGFVIVMLFIALRNRLALVSRLDGEGKSAGGASAIPLYRSVLVEQAAGLAVLATVALLGTIHPV